MKFKDHIAAISGLPSHHLQKFHHLHACIKFKPKSSDAKIRKKKKKLQTIIVQVDTHMSTRDPLPYEAEYIMPIEITVATTELQYIEKS